MRLEKLEIQGFKSFRDKTILEFPDKFTAIVGPNGSGKSNIVDAICFVLGKSRGLRVGNLKELIHNGGIDGKESNYAKITLHLTNSNNNTKISREVNNEGQSIYRIDNKRAARQEVVELVGDNEYNILLQDDVTKVIDMQPKERRRIIDDLCGIGEYDKKKAKAIKELEKVENRISDTHIILGEKKGYIEQLGKERSDALRYKKLNEELNKCNASILYNKIKTHEKTLESIDSNIEEFGNEKNTLTEKIGEIKTELEGKNKELKEINSQILEFEKEKGLAKIPEIRGELIRRQDRLDNLNKTLEDNKKTVHEKKDKKNKLIENINSLESKLTASREKIGFLDSKIKEESKKIKGCEVEEGIDKIKTRTFELKSKISATTESNEANKERIESFIRQKKEMKQRIHELIQHEKEIEKRIKERNKQHKNEFDEFEDLRSKHPEIVDRLTKIQDLLSALRVEYATKKTEIETVEKSSGGLKGVIRAVNNLKEVVDGVHGPIFQLGKVLNAEYEEAMKVAAGGRMYNIVVENENTAIKCIKYLREKKIGKATFLPLNKIRFRKQGKAPRGSIGFTREFITTNTKFKPAFDYVFGNTVLVRDLADAKKIGIGSFRMVTLKGDILTEGGAMTGGYARKIEIGFSKVDDLEKDIKALEQRIIQLDGERQELLLKKGKIEEKLSKLEAPVSNGRTDVERIKLEKDSIIDKVEDIEYRIEETDHIIKETKQLITNNIEKNKIIEKEIKTNEKELTILKKKRTETDISKLEKLKDNYRDLEVEEKTLEERIRLAKQQINDIDEELKKLSEEKTETENEITDTTLLRKELEQTLKGMEKENTQLMEKIKTLVEERSLHENNITKLGSNKGENEHKLESINSEINRLLIRKATIETKISDAREDFIPYTETEILDKKLKELEQNVQEIKNSLEDIGSVNLKSIETYDTVKKEFDEIQDKLETLKNERQSIFDFMEKVEQKKRETFNEAFDFVKKNFERLYMELGNGEGTLILSNPRDISESGLIIKASPKGKKLINIDSMSGGEKVLTCSAFLLAIQRYKPSYFYIVDEIDAALDKFNSLKLAQILKNSAAQFILISHNDEVIKKAESVIGVSMNNGVSQIVGVKLT